MEKVPSHGEQILVAAITALISLFGVILNLVCAISMMRVRIFRSSFGILTVCETLANAAELLLFLCYAAPKSLSVDPTEPSQQWVNRRFGQALVFFQAVSFHSVFAISINRFVALAYPVIYRAQFTTAKTAWIILGIIIISLAIVAPHFTETCYIYYNQYLYDWDFAETECGHFLSVYVGTIYNICLFVVVAIIDLLTLLKLRFNSKKLQNQTRHSEQDAKRRRRETMFFIQSCLTSAVFASTLFVYEVIEENFAETSFDFFLTTSFVWLSSHTLGGLIITLFNKEIRHRCLNPRSLFNSDLSNRAVAPTTISKIGPSQGQMSQPAP